ncbi:MAG: lipopolysaccharide biosynthesis protein [Sphingomicrobium sp.]
MLKALGKDVAIYGAGEFVFKLIAFSVFPIYAHIFTVAEFGVWGLLTVTATLLGFVVNLGVNQAVQRYYFDPAHSDQARIVSTGLAQLVASAVIIVGTLLLVAAAAGGAIERSYGIDRALLLLALATVVPDQLLQLCLDVLRLHFTPLRFLTVAFAKNMFGTAFALWLVVGQGAGLHGLFAGLLLGSVAALPLGLWLIRRELTWRIDRGLVRALFSFGFPLTLTSIASWIYTSVDRWMLADMSSAEQLGLYSMAAKFATILTFAIAAFAQAWVPFAIRLSRDDPAHPAFYGRVLPLFFFLLSFGAFAVALFSLDLLMLLTPAPFWPAATIIPVLVAGLALFGTTLVTALGITISRRTMYSTWATLIAAVVNVLLNLLLIPRFGAIGTAAATLLSFGLLTGALLHWSQRLHAIPIERGKLVYCLGLTVAVACLPLAGLGALDLAALAIKTLLLVLAIVGAFLVGIFNPSIVRSLRAKAVP